MSTYPNPFRDNFVVELTLETNKPRFMFYSLSGKEIPIQVSEEGGGKYRITPPDLPQGIYLLRVFDGQQWGQRKLVKE